MLHCLLLYGYRSVDKMGGAAYHSAWFLLLFFLAILSGTFARGDPMTFYKQQVVVILDDDPTVQKIGQLLYQKYETGSHVLKWNETTLELEQAEWNADAEGYEATQNGHQALPIGPQMTFTWSETIVQVVGVSEEQSITISGFTAEDMAVMITEQLAGGDVGDINIIGNASAAFLERPLILDLFMIKLKSLQRFNTAASLTPAIAMVDHSGRVLTGRVALGVNQSDMEWRHASPPDMWVGYFTGVDYQIELTPSEINPTMNSPSFGILPEGAEVYVSNYQSPPPHQLTYRVTDEIAFEWVDKIAGKTYKDAPRGRAPSFVRQVQFLSGSRDVREITVFEIEGIGDLLAEQHYHGDKGSSGDSSSWVYYRFGDWVLSMNKNNFDVDVEGIIVSPADTNERTAQVESILAQWRAIPYAYTSIQRETSSDFFEVVTLWINGEHGKIGLELEIAYDAKCSVAMFLSEPIRSFHVHITNMMSLDLAQHGYLSKEYFFSSHPMARMETWQILEYSGRKKTGLSTLRDHRARSGKLSDQKVQKIFDDVILRLSLISKSWLSHVDNAMIMGSRHHPPAIKKSNKSPHLAALLSAVQDIGTTAPWSHDYLREFELSESANHLLSPNMSEPEVGAINTQVQEFSHIDYDTLPLQASIALINDHAYVSDLISRELYQKEQETGKKYEVVPDTIDVDENSDIVKFFVREVANISSKLEQITTAFNKSQLQSVGLLEKLLSLSNKTKPIATWLKKEQSIASTIMGMVSSISELESGHTLKGAYDLAKNAYKFGDITGINKAAKEYLGKALKKLSNKAGESAASSSFAKGTEEGKFSKLVGKFNKLKEDFAPFMKAAMGIYNIYEDFHRHTTLGYIDGAFDIATMVLSYLGPEGEFISQVLSIIKMGIDYFYHDISDELHKLPPHASIGQKVVAVLKGIADGVMDFLKSIWQNVNIFGIISRAHKLDQEYRKEQDFLRGLANYANYYNINGTVINFAGGQDSWNGGNITFTLGEDGSSTLTLETVDTNSGQLQKETHDIASSNVADIILGIGEAHTFNFKTVRIKALFFTVHKKRVISKVNGRKDTLYGTYHGNSHNNSFIAVQDLPPQTESDLGYNLEDYHYSLYGGGGNDSFYLGPQPTYVEGNEGSDTYFINSSATITEINSHSGDGQEDTMIINLNFNQLLAQREGLNLKLSSSTTHMFWFRLYEVSTHNVVLLNWFHDVTHQRVVFKTGDGVLFKVSATITEAVELIAYALSGSSSTEPQLFDARLPLYSEVYAIAGSDYNDVLYGNDLDNQLNGAGGVDHLTGGEGQDTYTVEPGKGVDYINNFAVNEEVDTLVIGACLDQLIFFSREESDDLFITRRNESTTGDPDNLSTGAIVKNWFLNETYRHMVVVTDDKSIVKVSATKSPIVSYQPFIINMSQIEERAVERGESYARRLDLNSDPVYIEVTTVIGTPYNDYIIGNGKDNYLTGTKGIDYIEGREGADTYVVRKGDGMKEIVNCAKDTTVDTLLFDATFDEIQLSNTSNGDLVLSSSADGQTEVVFGMWFQTAECRHLLVRSVDGVTFELPNTTDSLTKTAKSVDNSNLTSSVHLVLADKWEDVERVIGSHGDDEIIGNSLDNYIDPGVGDCSLRGGNGSDTYVIQSTYGQENVINNYAEDDLTDIILFLVPYLTIEAVVDGNDILLSSLSGDGLVGIRIVDYHLEHAQHLSVTTSDGISFVLPEVDASNINSYNPLPMSLNLAQATTGQHMNLPVYPSFSEVRAVYGSIKYPNSIIGNGQNNTLVGGEKRDSLQGLEGDDILKGGGGDDIMEGGPGSDILVGEDGSDNLDGGIDDDIISPGAGANQVNGGPGTDTVIYSGNPSNEEGIILHLSLGTCVHDGDEQDSLINIENAYGTDYDDTLTGDDEDNVLIGKGGNDTLSPGTGYDILNGGNGSDIYDLTNANGTVTIENLASDLATDLIIMGFANLSSLWYEIAGDDIVLRVINSQYPVFYDGNEPAVMFKSFNVAPVYRHANIETADGSVVDLEAFISTGSGPPVSAVPSSLYVTLGALLIMLCAFVGCVIFGAYKVRANRRKSHKHYIKL